MLSGVPSATISPLSMIARLVGLLEVLGGEEDRGAGCVDAADLVPDGEPGSRVQSGRGLVEEQDLGLVDERARQIEAALHPSGIGLGPPFGGVRQTDQLEQLIGAVAPGGACDPIEPALELEQLAAGLHRIEPDLLQRDADISPHLVVIAHHVVARHQGAATGRRQQGAQHPDRGGLAGPVRPEEAEDLAFGNADVHPPHGLDAALEGAGQASGLDGRGFCVGFHQLVFRPWDSPSMTGLRAGTHRSRPFSHSTKSDSP